jgi:hypothetical protein
VNSQLKNNVYDVPEEVLNKINSTLSTIKDPNVIGIDRAKKLINDKKVTYGQLKRIIHDIKNLDKNTEQTRYNLYGGEVMEKWSNTFLDGERQLVRSKKLASHNINNNTGMNGLRKNPFRKEGERKHSNKMSVDLLKSNSEENSVSSLKQNGLFEQIKRIKKLM